jgi:hypothetical protein
MQFDRVRRNVGDRSPAKDRTLPRRESARRGSADSPADGTGRPAHGARSLNHRFADERASSWPSERACARQPEVRMSMCPVLGTLVPSGIHRTCRIVAGLAAYSASLPRKSKHGHTWPPPRARLNGNLELSRRINIVRHSRRAENHYAA